MRILKNVFAGLAVGLFLSGIAYSEDVRVYTDYTPVRILHLKNGANADVEAEKSGLFGNFKVMDSKEIPTDRTDRNAWKFSGGGIVVDQKIKKENDDKKNARASAIEKLKVIGLKDEELVALNLKEE